MGFHVRRNTCVPPWNLHMNFGSSVSWKVLMTRFPTVLRGYVTIVQGQWVGYSDNSVLNWLAPDTSVPPMPFFPVGANTDTKPGTGLLVAIYRKRTFCESLMSLAALVALFCWTGAL